MGITNVDLEELIRLDHDKMRWGNFKVSTFNM